MGGNDVKVRLTGELHGAEEGLAILCRELNVEQSPDGIEIAVSRSEGDLEAGCRDGRGWIRYDKGVHLFRAFGLWVQQYRKQHEFVRTETPRFDSNGAMIDASRNAVLSVASIKELLRSMALMGLNLCMLYTEDTFEVKEYPYFGYMRGRYTQEELRACDDYAFALGIELVPCIQTLGHLTEALKWNYAAEIRDTPDILLAGSEKTYEFIANIIRAVSEPMRSKRIHIGMDEAHQLGLGRYLDLNGYRKRFDIMNEHLRKVNGIAERLGLQPMIWSDMYFRLGSKTGGYYDLNAVIPQEVIEEMPNNVQLVYWDYYHGDADFYRQYIRKHRAFGSEPVFAGGIWTWGSVAPNYGKTRLTTEAALSACKAEGVREVFATLWGDNGAETSLFAALAGLQLFAEHGYAEQVDEADLAERFSFCTGGQFEDFMALNEFDETPGVSKGNMHESNPSKFLLWQDVLIGLYDKNVEGLPMSRHYEALSRTMNRAKERNGRSSAMFAFYEQLASVLQVKSELGLRLKAAYDRRDMELLSGLAQEIERLFGQVDILRKQHRSLWLKENKPFGWEAIDIRYGGLLARLDTARQRLLDFVDGAIAQVEELEAERLKFDAPWKMPEGALGRGAYHRIVTAGALSG